MVMQKELRTHPVQLDLLRLHLLNQVFEIIQVLLVDYTFALAAHRSL